jgi:hypothetical protein
LATSEGVRVYRLLDGKKKTVVVAVNFNMSERIVDIPGVGNVEIPAMDSVIVRT